MLAPKERIVVTAEGQRFSFRKTEPRDFILILGRMGLFTVARGKETDEEKVAAVMEALGDVEGQEYQDRFLAEMSIKPKLTAVCLDPQPKGTYAIPELPDDVYKQIVREVFPRSGVSKEDAAALDPSSGTSASS